MGTEREDAARAGSAEIGVMYLDPDTNRLWIWFEAANHWEWVKEKEEEDEKEEAEEDVVLVATEREDAARAGSAEIGVRSVWQQQNYSRTLLLQANFKLMRSKAYEVPEEMVTMTTGPRRGDKATGIGEALSGDAKLSMRPAWMKSGGRSPE